MSPPIVAAACHRASAIAPSRESGHCLLPTPSASALTQRRYNLEVP